MPDSQHCLCKGPAQQHCPLWPPVIPSKEARGSHEALVLWHDGGLGRYMKARYTSKVHSWNPHLPNLVWGSVFST